MEHGCVELAAEFDLPGIFQPRPCKVLAGFRSLRPILQEFIRKMLEKNEKARLSSSEAPWHA